MEQQNKIFTDIQMDAIGEILNISMGSAATSISGMLDKRVLITTPRVEVVSAEDIPFKSLEPAIGTEINYIEGLDGTNIMILKKSDVKKIVQILLNQEFSDEEFELDEMSLSAICEVMNQMMGASATALSHFLGRNINISTPTTFSIEDPDGFRNKYYEEGAYLISVFFNLIIEDTVNSEFVSVLPIQLAKELISLFETDINEESEEIIKESPNISADPVAVTNEEVRENKPNQTTTTAKVKTEKAQMHYDVRQAELQEFDQESSLLTEDQTTNLNLIMSVPLQITVEIGRVQKQIKDILEFTSGSIIELNKQAGAQVDIFVNGQPIAKGDVVVVEEFYGVRITEILSNSEIIKAL